MKKVSIIIVNWNGITDTSACLDSIKLMNTKGYVVETIVVDNGSTDKSLSVLRKEYTWVTLLATGENLGFTGGNNHAMHYALAHGADFIWLLNNDTIVSKNALMLAHAFDEIGVGIAGSKIYFAPGHEFHSDRYTQAQRGKVLWYAGGLIDWANMYASHRGVDEIDRGQYDKPESTDFVTGCSMMISRECMNRIGVLDDRYYLYLEDLDYCLRAKKANFALRYWPASTLWHVNAGSTGKAGNVTHVYYQTRNRIKAAMRYAPIRTKLAIARESMRFIFAGPVIKRKAVLDALLGNWGKQYEPKKISN